MFKSAQIQIVPLKKYQQPKYLIIFIKIQTLLSEELKENVDPGSVPFTWRVCSFPPFTFCGNPLSSFSEILLKKTLKYICS